MLALVTAALPAASVLTPTPSAAEPPARPAVQASPPTPMSATASALVGGDRLRELLDRVPDEAERRATRAAHGPAGQAPSPPPGARPDGAAARVTALRPASERPDRARRPTQTDVVEAIAAAAADAADPAEPADPVDPAEAGVTFATVGGEALVLARDVAVTVGFHESGDSRALPLEPVGTPTENLNPARFTAPPPSGDNGYLILPTRRRVGGPTSAVDLRMDSGVAVVAPVTGTVQTVATYTLYGRTPDVLVEIVPEGRPDLLVRMLHVEEVQVSEGAQVQAGTTVIAGTSRQLPFRSQIDEYAGAGPHVHMEVHARDPEAVDGTDGDPEPPREHPEHEPDDVASATRLAAR